MAAGHEVGGVLLKGWPAALHLLKEYSRLVASLYFALGALFVTVFVTMKVNFAALFGAYIATLFVYWVALANALPPLGGTAPAAKR